MKCKDIMSTNLEWLTEHDTIRTAANRMAETGVGFLPICDVKQRVVGVVTDRDLVTRGTATGVEPGSTSAALLMTSPALTCPETAELRQAEELMASEQKSRLAIVDTEGRFVGVLSIADLLEHAPATGALRTARAVLWREALGPRAGAEPGDLLLKDSPRARVETPPSDDIHRRETVLTGGHHAIDTKEFPG